MQRQRLPIDEFAQALDEPNIKQVVYPKNIDEIDHWVVFRPVKGRLFQKEDYPINQDLARIFLPLPANLSTSYNQTYNAEGIGVAGMAGASAVNTFMNQGPRALIDNILNISKEQVTSAGLYYGLQAAEENVTSLVGAAVNGISGAIVGAAAGQALKGAIAAQGLARNPYVAVMYDSPGLREHSFSWKFIARSIEESDAIQEAIYLFKYHSSPGMSETNPHFFQYPEQFDIDFKHGDYLHNIGPSVLTGMEVNYHSEGQPLYFNVSGMDEFGTVRQAVKRAPVSISLSLNFKEIFAINKKDIKGPSNNGKGGR